MTIELWLAPLIFVYGMIAGYLACHMEVNKNIDYGKVQGFVIALLWLPVIVLMISTFIAAKVLDDEGNPEG